MYFVGCPLTYTLLKVRPDNTIANLDFNTLFKVNTVDGRLTIGQNYNNSFVRGGMKWTDYTVTVSAATMHGTMFIVE